MTGTKTLAKKLIVQDLRNLVRNMDTRPAISWLMGLLENYLLTVAQIEKFVVNKADPHGLSQIDAALVAYLLDKTDNKPQRFPALVLWEMQKACLPTKIEVWARVVVWWAINHKRSKDNG